MVVTLIRRQKYETPPKTLTDVHGHQSLFCLGLVIHGQTNGFSRAIVFLCFTNNQAETVASFFLFANQRVWYSILTENGKRSKNVKLLGKMVKYESSVHNPKIEGLRREK